MYRMATLNKMEKLIQRAAKGGDLFEAKVFAEMLDFFEILDYLENDNHRKIVDYLYRGDHKGKTFDYIARSFNRSVSTLEDDRKYYQKTFICIYDKLKQQELTVA